jgi:pimeloyl-ACP methyl ester carboxylesterase
MWGRGNKLLPPDRGCHLAAQIPGARLSIIDNRAHAPSMDQPRAYLASLGDFLGAWLK